MVEYINFAVSLFDVEPERKVARSSSNIRYVVTSPLHIKVKLAHRKWVGWVYTQVLYYGVVM